MEENPSILSNKIYFNYCLIDVINFFLEALPLFPSLFKMWRELSKMISSNIAYLKKQFFFLAVISVKLHYFWISKLMAA